MFPRPLPASALLLAFSIMGATVQQLGSSRIERWDSDGDGNSDGSPAPRGVCGFRENSPSR